MKALKQQLFFQGLLGFEPPWLPAPASPPREGLGHYRPTSRVYLPWLHTPSVPPWLGQPLRGPLHIRTATLCFTEDANWIRHVNIKKCVIF